MPQLLALEWDQFEARVVVAHQRGEDVRLEQAFSVPLAPRDPGQTFADADVGQRLQAALAARRIGKAETLVAVGRSSIELRRLTLPPAPEEEWPELVRFQALPQFSNVGDDWPLDYFPLDTPPGEGASVLAATISPQLVKQISNTCASAGLTPKRLVLRPCAAASLLIQRSGPVAHRVRLFVDMLADEADLTVLVERDIVLMRTVRLPTTHSGEENAADQARALNGEIRRTIASAQNQLGGQRVGQVVLCGDGEQHREMARELANRLELPVEHFDPFATLRRSSELKSSPPQQPERFAPLLGMILDEVSADRHAIDFLNPRKSAPPKDNRRLLTIAGALAATVLLAIVALAWMELGRLNQRVTTLRQTSESLNKAVEQAGADVKQAEQLGEWSKRHPHWLNELEDLSTPERFPPAEDARIASFKAAPQPRGGGTMSLAGYVRDSDVIEDMELRLRDPAHTVVSGRSDESDKDPRYPRTFQELVKIGPRGDEDSDSRAASGQEDAR